MKNLKDLFKLILFIILIFILQFLGILLFGAIGTGSTTTLHLTGISFMFGIVAAMIWDLLKHNHTKE